MTLLRRTLRKAGWFLFLVLSKKLCDVSISPTLQIGVRNPARATQKEMTAQLVVCFLLEVGRPVVEKEEL